MCPYYALSVSVKVQSCINDLSLLWVKNVSLLCLISVSVKGIYVYVKEPQLLLILLPIMDKRNVAVVKGFLK